MADIPVICIFGIEGVELETFPAPEYETRKLDCRCFLTDKDLVSILAENRPSAILSFGNKDSFLNLHAAPFYIRKTWLHFDSIDSVVGQRIFDSFITNISSNRPSPPLVSVFTPTYKTGERIWKPYRSLKGQTYKDWEWVVVDDSDDHTTFPMLSSLANRDFRLKVFKESKHSGVIGHVKKMACGLSRGSILVELDHDDELTPKALEWVVNAFAEHPEAGFVYTDFAECTEDGNPVIYGKGWGLGYGSYRKETHGGILYEVVNSPNINAKTIRHIVAAPNHIRAWRKTVYDQIGGHNDSLHVVDDYELVIRTFLNTRMIKIPKMCYVQYRNESGNTSLGVRNKEIQRLVRFISSSYDSRIHERFVELGVDDFVWSGGDGSFLRLGMNNPEVEPHCTIIYNPD